MYSLMSSSLTHVFYRYLLFNFPILSDILDLFLYLLLV